MKAQIVLWLLGATDGHAKNFSISLHPGGGFRLTPLYDVMSLQPAYDAKQIKRNRMKLAMSVGNQRHYVVDSILPRHFTQSAARARMPATAVEQIMDELADQTPKAAEQVAAHLPRDFPKRISESIIRALIERSKLLRER